MWSQILILPVLAAVGVVVDSKEAHKLPIRDARYHVDGNDVDTSTWRGLDPDQQQHAMNKGCLVHSVGVKSTVKKLLGHDLEKCKASCKASDWCIATMWLDYLGGTCFTIKEFLDYGLNFADKVFFKNCKDHYCYRTCHCTNADPSRDLPTVCQYEDETYVDTIFHQARKRLNIGRRKAVYSADTLEDYWVDFLDMSITRENIEVITMKSLEIKTILLGTFDGMTSLKYLNLDDNLLQEVEGIFPESLVNLEALMLLNNRIMILSKNTFANIPNLKYLDVSANPFQYVGSDVFTSLSNLETLHLKSNRQLQIPGGAFDGLKSLKYLTITGGSEEESYDLKLLESLPKLKSITVPPNYNPARFEHQLETFSTNYCVGYDCYSACNVVEPSYLDTEDTHHSFYLDLGSVYNQRGKHTFIAQTVHVPPGGSAILPDNSNWYILTREFLVEGDLFLYKEKGATALPCIIRPVWHSGKKLYRFLYDRLDVLAHRIHIKAGSIHRGKCKFADMERVSPPGVLDETYDEFVDRSMKCAELLSYTEDYHEAAIDTLKAITHVFNVESKSLLFKSAMLKANIKDRFRPENEGPHFVPYMSLKVVRRDYIAWARHASYTMAEYEALNRQDLTTKDWEMLYRVMSNMTEKITEFSDLITDNAKKELQMAERGVEKLRAKYAAQLKAVQAARDSVRDALSETYYEASMAYARALMEGAMGIFTAVRTLSPGAILTAAEDAWDEYEGHMENVEALSEVANACQGMLNMIESGNMDIQSVETYLNDIEKASDLKVRLVEWDHMASQITSVLVQTDMEDTPETTNFELAVSQLAGWGKKLTEEVINQANLIRRVGEKIATSEARREQAALAKNAANRQAYRGRDVNQAITKIQHGIIDEKLTLLEMQALYCQSYRHYFLDDCDRSMHPNIDDGLTQLIRKASRSKGMELESLLRTMNQPPHGIEEVIFLKDEVPGEECKSPKNCLVSAFKKFHSITFTVPLDSDVFLTNDRVRLKKIEVYFEGLQGDGAYSVSMKSEPFFKDRRGDREFEFYTVPRVYPFKYNVKTGRMHAHGSVHEDYEHLFTQITPFTEWTLSYDPQYNKDIDFSQVTSIQITFGGSAISRLGKKK